MIYPKPGLTFHPNATPKPRAGEHVRWADQYDFDRSDPATRLFIAASNWVDRCEAAEAERDSLREVLGKAHAHLLAYNYDGHTYGENAAMLAEITALLAKHGR